MLEHEYELMPSWQYAGFFVCILLLCLPVIACLPFVLWQKALLSMALLTYGASLIRKYALLTSRSSIFRIKYDQKKVWLLQSQQAIYEGRLLGDSTVTPWISILRFKVPEQRFPVTCIILRDSLPGDLYRQLMVLLRLG